MFPWNFAKSAEAMFPRWAIKHICKFVLKKKLGQFIIGDLDLDQLDIQLGAGTLQLSDLALNVDYLNQKLGATPFIVKEGSIGSLLVKFPWRVRNCEIEVEELELILAPCVRDSAAAAAETCNSTHDCEQSVSHSSENNDHETGNDEIKPISLDIHEGVKTIAKMVRWLLTSFNVKIKNLIVAYDPGKDDTRSESHRALVLRITQTEYGTCFAEDANASSDSRVDSFLGISKLTNFMKFDGAVIELLHMDDIENQTHLPSTSGTTFGDSCMGKSASDANTPILTGEGGGFSGTMNLSIPWKNGTLDIQKVDSDISIDPLELRLQPSTIMWIICLWESLKKLDKDDEGLMHDKGKNSVYHNSASQFHSSFLSSSIMSTDQAIPRSESLPADAFYVSNRATTIDAMIQSSHVIADWVPFSSNKNQNSRCEAGSDIGASIDQFFECFDGLRTSQSALGSSGMWNWTCPVFSAITAASSLASGSLNILSEQQPVKTNLKATVAEFSVVLSLHDEDQKYSYDKVGRFDNTQQKVHYLGLKCQDILLDLQISSCEMKFETMIKHIALDDYYYYGKDADGFDLNSGNSTQSQTLSIQHMQAGIHSALPLFTVSQNTDSEEIMNRRGVSHRIFHRDDLVQMKLLRTSSDSSCQFKMTSTYGSGDLVSSTSFSVKLPPFILWLNINLLSMVLDLLKQVGDAFEMRSDNNGSGMDSPTDKLNSTCHGDVKRCLHPGTKTFSTQGGLLGNVVLPNARFILCFPSDKRDVGCYSSWDQFIGLDISQSLSKEKVPNTYPVDENLQRGFSSNSSSSIHLNIGNLKVYLISTSRDAPRCDSSRPSGSTYFSAYEILSVTNRLNFLSGISIILQDGPVTGPWIANRARSLATSQVSRSRDKVRGKGYEFASVTSMGNLEDINSSTRQEIILSSSIFLHIRLSSVLVKLDSLQYQLLSQLLNQAFDVFSHVSSSNTTASESIKKETVSAQQTSVLVECNSVEIITDLDRVEDIKCSIQKELPGYWDSAKLQIQKFDLLSVSNIGGIKGCNFTWLGHGEGELRGSIGGKDLLLISCSSSTMRRGDGEGANALSLGSAGTSFFHMQEPHTLQSFTSVTVRCGTVIAPGGRVDWLNAICNLFSSPSCETEPDMNNSVPEDFPEGTAAYGTSFALNLVDIGFVYEPHFTNLVVSSHVPESKLNATTSSRGELGQQYVGCLLAAASLSLSNKTIARSVENEYKIRVQDLGFLLCELSSPRSPSCIYNVKYLRKAGYVKVAREALLDFVLKTQCKNGLLWELECSDCLINLDTCHDTFSGLIRLAAQLQQLYAPDMEESASHLQTRWNTVQKALNKLDITIQTGESSVDSASSSSHAHRSPEANCSERYQGIGLMDEICEDAFNLHGYETSPSALSGRSKYSHSNTSDDGLTFRTESGSTQASSFREECFPELIEGYYVAGLNPLPEVSHSPDLDVKPLHTNKGHGQVGSGNSGWYQNSSPQIVEDHIPKVSENLRQDQLLWDEFSSSNNGRHDEFSNAKGRLLLKKIDVRWRMYAGSDWPHSQDIQLTAKKVGRDTTVCLELMLSGLGLQYDMFPDGDICVSKLSLSVRDLNLYDRSRDAPWKLVLGYYNSKDRPRESSSKAFKLDLESVRPDPSTPLEEYRLRLALLPLLLHLDQDQLDFLISFFGNKGSSVDQPSSISHDLHRSASLPAINSDLQENAVAEEAFLPYFQKFDIWPVVLRVDYKPRRVDLAALRGGNYVHLVNLVRWKGIELQLKHVNAVGIYGWSSVCETIAGEWLEDISHNQMHKFLKGLPAIRSLFTVGTGAAKLVSLPVQNYKDNRLLTGIQRGAVAFLKSISLEAVGLGVHLAAGAHEILLQTEYILTSIPPSLPTSARNTTKTNISSNQPKDAQQGMQQAYESLSDGLGKTAAALVATPLKTYQRGGGAGSALASAVCAAPAAAIAPASAAIRAVHCTLLGFRNSLDPEHKKESLEKYLGPDQRHENN